MYNRLGLLLLLWAGLALGEIKDKGWWRNTVFYQVYPRSFKDSDGDGIGDLNGITSKLHHFKESGIGAIWLSPIYASPMVDFGYDISDFRIIDEAFGSMDGLVALTKKAEELGIKVIMDLVPNHTSDKHEWFIKSYKGEYPYTDYYMWRKGKNHNTEPPNNWISLFSGSAWTFNATRGQWYLHQFEYRQPDLDYTNPNVRKEMEDIILFWLDKGIDGFRVDAVPHLYERDDLPDEPRSNLADATDQDYRYLNHIYTKDDPRTYELIQSWRNILDNWADKRNESEKIMMTEAYTSLENTTKYYYCGSHIPFNFNFIMSVSNTSKPEDFKKVIDDWMSHTPENGSANWVMGNHDRSRTATRYLGRADQMTMLAMILPGVAVTYNGEEIAMEDKLDISWEDTQDPQACNTDPEHYKLRTRDPNRTPFQWDNSTSAGFSTSTSTWLPVHENYKTLNLARQKFEAQSHYNIYRNLTALRRMSDSLKNGKLTTEVINGEVLAVIRQGNDDTVVLLINFSDSEEHSINMTSYSRGAANVTVYVSSVGSNIPWKWHVDSASILLPAKASLVLRTSGAYSVQPMKIVWAATLLILFKLMLI